MSIRLGATTDTEPGTATCGIDVEHGGCSCGAVDHVHPKYLASLRARTQQLSEARDALFSDDFSPIPPNPRNGGGAATDVGGLS